MRNKYVSVVVNGQLSNWTGPNPSVEEDAIQRALKSAELSTQSQAGVTAYPVLITQILPDDTLMTLAGIRKKTGYIVHGSTGCSCCRSENFVEGIYETSDAAIDRAGEHQKRRTVRSQCSDTGIYTVREIEYERLPDGRVIIGNRVFDNFDFMEFGEEISESLSYEGKAIISTQ